MGRALYEVLMTPRYRYPFPNTNTVFQFNFSPCIC